MMQAAQITNANLEIQGAGCKMQEHRLLSLQCFIVLPRHHHEWLILVSKITAPKDKLQIAASTNEIEETSHAE